MADENHIETGADTPKTPHEESASDRANVYVRVGKNEPEGPIRVVSFGEDIFDLLEARREKRRAGKAEAKSRTASHFELPLKDFFDATLSFMLASDTLMSFGSGAASCAHGNFTEDQA